MDHSIRRRIANDDLTSDEADALDWNRAEDRSDEDRDNQALEEMNNE
jgi:hypothetical protein